jgi:uncharacterized membrane protein YccC
MFAAVSKAFAVAGLIIALFWRSPNYEALLSFLVCVAALVVVGQAIQLKNVIWIPLFLAVCALFNPVFPVTMSRNVHLTANLVCAVLFASSLLLLKTLPPMSVLSITDRTPGSESL